MSIKKLSDDNLTLRTINQASITMTESLSVTDDGFHERILFLDPAGFTRTVIPLGTFRAGYTIIIFNLSSSNVIIFDPNILAYTIRESKIYGPGSFTYTGSEWECRSPSRVFLSEFSGSVDDLTDGVVYGRVLLTNISAGSIVLAECIGTLDDIADGTDYAKVASTSISAGKIVLTDGLGITGFLSLGDFTDAGVLATQNSIGTFNFISNGDFAMWTNVTTVPIDWNMDGSGVTIARSSARFKIGVYSAALTNAAGQLASLYQYLHVKLGISYFYGKTISLSIWVWASTASRVRVVIEHDGYGGGTYYSNYHSGGSVWEQLTVVGHIIPSDATFVATAIRIDSGTSITAYVDAAMSIDGSVIPGNWIPYGPSSPSASGAIVSSGYFALMKNSVFRFVVNNNGDMALRTSSGTYGFYYYGAASGSYGEGDLIIGNGSSYIWWDQSAGNFQIYSSGEFRVLGSGIIRLIGDNSSPGKITFDGSEMDVSLSCTANGYYLNFSPSSTNVNTGLFLGVHGTQQWGTIDIIATSYINTHGTIRPVTPGTFDLGSDTQYYRDIHYANLHDVADYFWLDEFNDLKAMIDMQPLKSADGEYVRDAKTGLVLVDDDTWPDFVLSRHHDAVPEEVRYDKYGNKTVVAYAIKAGTYKRTPDGRPFINGTAWKSWMMGCVKQLKIEMDELTKKIDSIKL